MHCAAGARHPHEKPTPVCETGLKALEKWVGSQPCPGSDLSGRAKRCRRTSPQWRTSHGNLPGGRTLTARLEAEKTPTSRPGPGVPAAPHTPPAADRGRGGPATSHMWGPGLEVKAERLPGAQWEYLPGRASGLAKAAGGLEFSTWDAPSSHGPVVLSPAKPPLQASWSCPLPSSPTGPHDPVLCPAPAAPTQNSAQPHCSQLAGSILCGDQGPAPCYFQVTPFPVLMPALGR